MSYEKLGIINLTLIQNKGHIWIPKNMFWIYWVSVNAKVTIWHWPDDKKLLARAETTVHDGKWKATSYKNCDYKILSY